MNAIEVMDYLSESEMKDIAKQVFRESCQDKYKKDHERIITNSAYEIIVEIIKDYYPEGLEDLVAKKSVDVINNLSSTVLFGQKNVWDRETTGGFESLQKAIADNSELIQNKAKKMIKEYRCIDNESYIEDLIKEEIVSRLFNKKGEEL